MLNQIFVKKNDLYTKPPKASECRYVAENYLTVDFGGDEKCGGYWNTLALLMLSGF